MGGEQSDRHSIFPTLPWAGNRGIETLLHQSLLEVTTSEEIGHC